MALPKPTNDFKIKHTPLIPLHHHIPASTAAILWKSERYFEQQIQMAMLNGIILGLLRGAWAEWLWQRMVREAARKHGWSVGCRCADCQPSPIPFPAPSKPPTRITFHEGVHLHEWTFVEWAKDSLIALDHTGIRREIKREKLLHDLLAQVYSISGDRPAWAMLPNERKPEAKPIPKPINQDDTFVASRFAGGGKMRVQGEWWDWSKVQQRCVCAECSATIRTRLSDEPAPSKANYGAYYYCCDAGHVIKGERHVRIKISRYVNPDVMPPGSLAAVKNAYPWINATTDADEPPPF